MVTVKSLVQLVLLTCHYSKNFPRDLSGIIIM